MLKYWRKAARVLVPALLLPLCSCGDDKTIVLPGLDDEEPVAIPVGPTVPQPQGDGYEVEPGRITFNHTVGRSPCPQRIGTIRFHNTSNGTLKFKLKGGTGLITVLPSEGEAEPGEFVALQVFFNCTRRTPFSARLIFEMKIDDIDSQDAQVIVVGNIQ
jgi:hypothetical protein